MKKVLIIGGGLAGLTAASILSAKKYSVTLLESSPKLGGRTYSFKDDESHSSIDNGQHILMGCYQETLKLIKLINAASNFYYQKNLELNFLSKERILYALKADKLFYPFNLLYAILNYDVLTLNDKISFISFVIKLPLLSRKSLLNLSVMDWLKNNNQSGNAIKMFWEILCVGAMNTNLSKASAEIFHNILIQIFFKGNFSSTIILPKFGLSESIIKPAKDFILKQNGNVLNSETVKEILVENNVVKKVSTSENVYDNFDYVISAVPLFALEKIIDVNQLRLNAKLNYSSILNIHLWIDVLQLDEKFYGFLSSPLHWIFKKDNHFNIVISDGDYLIEKTKDEILDFLIDELSEFINIKKESIINSKILKEKRATFIPEKNVNQNRPHSNTKIKNLFLAGDWINTGLPSTIESAVKSGRLAAEEIINLSK